MEHDVKKILKGFTMIYVGIDVAKSKHDCVIIDCNAEILEDVFQIENSITGFTTLKNKILKHLPNNDLSMLKIGIEDTGHYSNNIISFILQNKFPLVRFNPLITNFARKSNTLRKTKTDKIDAVTIATLLFHNSLKKCAVIDENIIALKNLSRNRYRLTGIKSKLKMSITRLIDIVFPELSGMFSSLHLNSVYALLLKFPTTNDLSKANLKTLTSILEKHSKGKFKREKAIEVRNLAKISIGSNHKSLGLELQQTIRLVETFNSEIKICENEIKSILESIKSPITSIPGISFILGATILSEIININNFNSPAKLLAFAGMEPSTYQSGKFCSTHARMVKRGSKYLRWALMNAARLSVKYCETFATYFNKKIKEGKHYFVALSHVARKLVRVIFHLLTTNQTFQN